MKDVHTLEIFTKAIHIIATTSDPIQKRIANAFNYELVGLGPEELPAGVRDKFVQIRAKVTSIRPTGDEGSINATTAEMSNETAEEIANELWDIYQAIIDDYYRS